MRNPTDLSPSSAKVIWLLIIACMFPAYAFFQLSSLNVLSQYLLRLFPNNINIISSLSSVYLLTDAIMLIPAGIILESFKLKYVMSLALFIILAGILIFSYSSNIICIYTGRILMGIGHSFAFLSGFKIVRNITHKNKWGMSMAFVISIAMVGGALAQAPLAYTVAHYGVKNTLFVNFIIGLFLLVISVYALSALPENIIKFNINSLHKKLIMVVRNPINSVMGIVIGILSAPLLLLGTSWGNLYLMHVVGLSVYKSTVVTSLVFISVIVSMPAFGFFSDIFRRDGDIVLSGSIICLILSILFLLLHNSSFYVQAILVFLLSFFSGVQVLGYVFVNKKNIPSIQNTALAYSNVVIMLVGSLLPYLFSKFMLVDNIIHDENTSHSILYGFIVMPVLFLVAIIIFCSLKKRIE